MNKLTVTSLPRVFSRNGVEVPDPAPGQSLEAAKRVLATVWPDIQNSAIEGPEIQAGREVYKLVRAVRDKG